MPRKTHDLVIKNGEYQDRDGQTKARWLNVGRVMEGEKGRFILLDRTVNLAGIPNPENRDSVIVSVFPVKERDGEGQGSGGGTDFGDSEDIPFQPAWR